MTTRTIAIGDIHGCAAAWEALLDAIQPQQSDQIITLGDYIDRGPDSRAVVERTIQLAGQCQLVPLLGNHEALLQMALRDEKQREVWLGCGGQETLHSYGGTIDQIPRHHLDFFDECGVGFETEHHMFFHASYEPGLALEKQTEVFLLWAHLRDPLPAPHISGKVAVVGHTPQVSGEVLDVGHLICLDTYCFGGGWLTAMDMDTGQIWQADRAGQLRQEEAV